MHTTLNRIYDARPCKRGWNALLNYTGKASHDDDAVSFHTIYNATGLLGAIWCLRTLDGHELEKQEFLEYCNSGKTQEEITIKFLEIFGE